MISSIRFRNSGRKCSRSCVHHLPSRAFVDVIDQELAAEVRGHDDDGVLEIDGSSLTVRQPAIVEQLQQDVQHVGMRFLDLVEQHDRVGTTTNGFGELSGLVVAHVAWRRADHPRHRVLLLVFGHVDAHHRLLVIEQELGERARELGLADAGRARGTGNCRAGDWDPAGPRVRVEWRSTPRRSLRPVRSRAGEAALPCGSASGPRPPSDD